MSAAIHVCVLEGNHARLTELGLPLSLAVELQSHNLRLDSSLWTARSSNGGYSVSFFWPSLQRKRSRRRRRRKPPNNHPATSTTKLLSTNLPLESHLSNTSGPAPGNSEAKFVPLIPSNAHFGKKTRAPSNPVATLAKESAASHSPKLNESSTGNKNTHDSVKSDPPSHPTDSDSQQHIDLKACTDVKYEKHGCVHGVIVQQHDNNQTWTPVYSKIRKRIPLSKAQLRKIPPHCCHPPPSDDDSSSESDTPLTCTIPENATVNYKVADGTPGLSITTRKTRHWTPIASRTRAQTRTLLLNHSVYFRVHGQD